MSTCSEMWFESLSLCHKEPPREFSKLCLTWWPCYCSHFHLITHRLGLLQVWWVYSHYVLTKPLLSLPLLDWKGERTYDERFRGQNKDREITRQLVPWTKQTQLREIKTHSHPSLPFFPGSTWLPPLLCSAPEHRRGTDVDVAVGSPHIATATPVWGPYPRIQFLTNCSNVSPSPSLPPSVGPSQTASAGSIPWGAVFHEQTDLAHVFPTRSWLLSENLI